MESVSGPVRWAWQPGKGDSSVENMPPRWHRGGTSGLVHSLETNVASDTNTQS